MLPTNQAKEQLSLAYLRAVAASCNFGVEQTQIDMDSVDASVVCYGYPTKDHFDLRSPEIKIQMKATQNLRLGRGGTFVFSLSVKNYDDLRLRSGVPRLLLVFLLPRQQPRWLTHTPKDLTLRKCAYWLSLLGLPETHNQQNVTVYLPKANLFSPQSLKLLIDKASRGEDL